MVSPGNVRQVQSRSVQFCFGTLRQAWFGKSRLGALDHGVLCQVTAGLVRHGGSRSG
jgi:hypothetical protein